MNDEIFKATNIFDTITKDFENGIELKTHKRRLKCYKNSFLASKGVDFLFSLLKNNEQFSNKIEKRNQAISLMNIFLKWGIIKKIYPTNNLNKFFDNKDIYILEEKKIKEPIYESLNKSFDKPKNISLNENFENDQIKKDNSKNYKDISKNYKDNPKKLNKNLKISEKNSDQNLKSNQLTKSTSCFLNSSKNSIFVENQHVRQSLRKIQFNNQYKENLFSINPMNDINLEWSKVEAEGNNILKFLTKISLKKWPLKNSNSHNINMNYSKQIYNNTLV